MRTQRPRRVVALVWRRTDLRESSRLVTLLTAEFGRVTALAKGAHRANSVLLGRLDLLNRVEAELAGRGLPLLGGARLLHEPRRLRHATRYASTVRVAEVLDPLWLPDQPDPNLFELTVGAIALLERAPLDSLPVVTAGLECRVLQHLGAWVDPTRCSTCDRPLTEAPLALDAEGGLRCPRHAPPGARPAAPDALVWLGELADSAGRDWPRRRPAPATRAATDLLRVWLQRALDRALSNR